MNDTIRYRITHSQPLYRAESFGLELSEDRLQTDDYIKWFVALNYPLEPSLFQ